MRKSYFCLFCCLFVARACGLCLYFINSLSIKPLTINFTQYIKIMNKIFCYNKQNVYLCIVKQKAIQCITNDDTK